MRTHCFLLCQIGSQLFIFLSKFGDGFFILFHGPLRTFEIGFPVSICKENNIMYRSKIFSKHSIKTFHACSEEGKK